MEIRAGYAGDWDGDAFLAGSAREKGESCQSEAFIIDNAKSIYESREIVATRLISDRANFSIQNSDVRSIIAFGLQKA